MKKLMLALVALFTVTVQASAMSYEQAREQALFLTDKMAYELNLTDDQYEAAYEINLDYLMGITSYDDLYGMYWRQRNLDLSYILFDWQYRMYCDASYFYRPLYWDGGFWHFRIYARYPHRDYFYFGRPGFYVSYRGGHSWRMNGGRSWYHGRTWGGPRPGGDHRIGMRDGFQRGDYGRGTRMGQGNRTFGNGTRFGNQQQGGQPRFGTRNGVNHGTRSIGNGNSRTFGNGNSRVFGNSSRESSTRTTVTRPSGSTFGSRSSSAQPRGTFSPNGTRSGSTRSFGSGAPSRSFGGSSSAPSRSFGSSAPTRSSSSSSFGGGSRSFGGGNNAPARSFGGGNNSGSHSSGGHFGRR